MADRQSSSSAPSSQEHDKIPGVSRHGAGWRCRVVVNGERLTKTFPLSTPIAQLRDWQASMRYQAVLEAEDAAHMAAHFEALNWAALPALPDIGLGCAEYVYFIKASRFVKIGRSTNPLARVTDLQCAHPTELRLVAVIPCQNGIAAERGLHAIFTGRRRLGEWFELDWTLGAFVDEVRAKGITEQRIQDMVANRRNR
jgi:hypothetical protein